MPRSRIALLTVAAIIGFAALWSMRPPRPPGPKLPTTAPSNPTSNIPRPTSSLILPTDPIRGDRSAPLVIVEFSDFSCPACAEIQETLSTLREEYGNRLAIVWKDLPHLDRITGSQRLHIAARCASILGSNDAFWTYHDALFRTHAPDEETLLTIADALRLPRPAFQACQAAAGSASASALIAANAAAADALGITATPTLFVNGTRVPDPATPAAIRTLLERANAAN